MMNRAAPSAHNRESGGNAEPIDELAVDLLE
jgi:hypothetical protein